MFLNSCECTVFQFVLQMTYLSYLLYIKVHLSQVHWLLLLIQYMNWQFTNLLFNNLLLINSHTHFFCSSLHTVYSVMMLDVWVSVFSFVFLEVPSTWSSSSIPSCSSLSIKAFSKGSWEKKNVLFKSNWNTSIHFVNL